jgi:hypothetical protein
MRTRLFLASILLFALGSAPAIKSAPIGFQKSTHEQSLIPVQKKKGWGKGKRAGKGKGKGKGPDCFQRCIAKGEKGPAGCSARCN